MELPPNALRDLHLLHQRIDALRQKRDRGPRQLEARRALIARHEEDLRQNLDELKRLKMRAHEKESYRRGLESRASELQIKINQAKDNNEYAALVAEREATRAAAGALEDEILDLLFRQDELAQANQQAEAELERMRKELEQFQMALEQEQGGIARQLADAEQELHRAEAQLPGELQDNYRRLVNSRGKDALAVVERNSCTGCFTSITAQMYNQLLAHELVLCKSCGRILYLDTSTASAR